MELDTDDEDVHNPYQELVDHLANLILQCAHAFDPRLPVPHTFLTALLPQQDPLFGAAADQAFSWLAERGLIGEAGDPDWNVILPQMEALELGPLTAEVMPGTAMSIQETVELVVAETVSQTMLRYDRQRLRDVLPQAMHVTDRALRTGSRLGATLCAWTGVALAWVGWSQAESYLDRLLTLDIESLRGQLTLLAAQIGVQSVVAAERGNHEQAARYSKPSSSLLRRSQQRRRAHD